MNYERVNLCTEGALWRHRWLVLLSTVKCHFDLDVWCRNVAVTLTCKPSYTFGKKGSQAACVPCMPLRVAVSLSSCGFRDAFPYIIVSFNGWKGSQAACVSVWIKSVADLVICLLGSSLSVLIVWMCGWQAACLPLWVYLDAFVGRFRLLVLLIWLSSVCWRFSASAALALQGERQPLSLE